MLSEKLDLIVDVERLHAEFLTNVKGIEPVIQSPKFGGWAVTSSTGAWDDGWDIGIGLDVDADDNLRTKRLLEYRIPTSLHTGYVCEVLEEIESLGFFPSRVRYSMLDSGGQSPWHSDSHKNAYAKRIHIPLTTNPSASFCTVDGVEHLRADGSVYIVDTKQMHQVFNFGKTPRVHLIMGCWDTRGITKAHKYTGNYLF